MSHHLIEKSDSHREFSLYYAWVSVDSIGYLFYVCSAEGVSVVLQILDLLCKLKNDVIGLKVCGFSSAAVSGKMSLASCNEH